MIKGAHAPFIMICSVRFVENFMKQYVARLFFRNFAAQNQNVVYRYEKTAVNLYAGAFGGILFNKKGVSGQDAYNRRSYRP